MKVPHDIIDQSIRMYLVASMLRRMHLHLGMSRHMHVEYL